jgi:flagellar basal-body rod protein FlgB
MDKGFRILHKLVQAANMRQRVISSNVANAETPGYKAKDLKFGNLLGKEVKLLTTNPGHIGKKSADKVNGKLVVENNLSWGDRNNVELNVEIAKMTENALFHNAAIKILSKKIKMFKNAIKPGGQ